MLHDAVFQSAVNSFLARQQKFQDELSKAIATGDEQAIVRIRFQMSLDTEPGVEAAFPQAPGTLSPTGYSVVVTDSGPGGNRYTAVKK